MGIRSIVFDFDGTLIDSNPLKAKAYFQLFPADPRHARIIVEVLSELFEQSRYVILEEILRRLGIKGKEARNERVINLAKRYNDMVLAGAKTCPEKPGAEESLKKLDQIYTLFVSSTTPEASLKEIIRFRRWEGYFRGVFGYPHEKKDTLRRILASEKLKGDQVLVVGDGESDRKAAAENGCRFVHVGEGFCFERMNQILAGYAKNDSSPSGRKVNS